MQADLPREPGFATPLYVDTIQERTVVKGTPEGSMLIASLVVFSGCTPAVRVETPLPRLRRPLCWRRAHGSSRHCGPHMTDLVVPGFPSGAMAVLHEAAD